MDGIMNIDWEKVGEAMRTTKQVTGESYWVSEAQNIVAALRAQGLEIVPRGDVEAALRYMEVLQHAWTPEDRMTVRRFGQMLGNPEYGG
jgi:hypothetical protein